MIDRAHIQNFIKVNQDTILEDIKALVDIPSVEDKPLQNAPFGENVKKALDKAIEIAERLGLQAENCDGYLAYAKVDGKSTEHIATIAHVDVVSEGNGWDFNPFDMQIKDGYLIGRGVLDDKGPAILTLYAAKYLKDYCPNLKYSFRALLGASEETGMKDISYYLSKNPEPLFCLTPDGEYPVCHGEKGIYTGSFISKSIENGALLELEGGVASNVVPDRATALLNNIDASRLPHKNGILIENENGLTRIKSFGKGGHAAMPENTVNAIGMLVDYIINADICSDAENEFLQLLQDIFSVNDGSGLGIACDDRVFTPLTCIGGVISLKSNMFVQNINIRYPTVTNEDKLTQALCAKAAKHNAEFKSESNASPLLISQDSEVINVLLQTYNDVMQKNKKPFTMGGGTYARHFAKGAAFGVNEEDMIHPPFVGEMHGANEGVSVDLLMKSLEIYIIALLKLMQLEL